MFLGHFRLRPSGCSAKFFLLLRFSLAQADGMDDVPRLEIATAGDHCATDRTAADFIAFPLYGGATLGADSAGHSRA